MDHWAKQVYQAYRSVIFRRRFRVQLISEVISDTSVFSAALEFRVHGDTFMLSANAFPHGGMDIWVFSGSFSYSAKFGRHRESRLHHQALILMKKISNKAVYDVMKT